MDAKWKSLFALPVVAAAPIGLPAIELVLGHRAAELRGYFYNPVGLPADPDHSPERDHTIWPGKIVVVASVSGSFSSGTPLLSWRS